MYYIYAFLPMSDEFTPILIQFDKLEGVKDYAKENFLTIFLVEHQRNADKDEKFFIQGEVMQEAFFHTPIVNAKGKLVEETSEGYASYLDYQAQILRAKLHDIEAKLSALEQYNKLTFVKQGEQI